MEINGYGQPSLKYLLLCSTEQTNSQKTVFIRIHTENSGGRRR